MSLVVKTNVSSLTSQRHLNSTNRALQGNMSKLSSGFRINTAADDAAGLAISEEMKRDVRSLSMASRNANDAISVVQTAEGALGEVGNILGRMRELVVQSNNGALNNDQRSHIQTELQQLKIEIDDINTRTQFNGKSLLDGSSMSFQVGIGGTETVNFQTTMNFDTASLGTSTAGGVGMSLGIGSIYVATGTFTIDDDNNTTSIGAAGATSTTAFDASLKAIDKAINQVSTQRAAFGAMQNRVESKLDNLAVFRENIEAANSRIRDVDFASEMASMTKNQILMQAGTAMLAQANALPQSALSLLR